MKFGPLCTLLAGVTLALAVPGTAAVASAPMTQQKQDKTAENKASLYPNATREEPKLDLTSREDAEAINKASEEIANGDYSRATALLLPYAQGEASDSRYAQVIALQGLSNIDYAQDKREDAIAKIEKALLIGVMPNDTYFGLMYNLAQLYASTGEKQKALDTLHKWRNEGKRETADSYGLEGVLDYQLGKYKEAITAIEKAKTLTDKPKANWTQVLAASYAETGQGGNAIAMARKALKAKPDDAVTRNNLISLLISSGKNDAAIKAMEKARALGQLTSKGNWINMAKLYLVQGQNSGKDPRPYADKALAVLKDGLAKGLLKPDYDVYKLEGNAAIIGGYDKQALTAFTKAAELSKDGGADLMRARLLAQSNKHSAARAAARKALAKGTQHEGQAYMVIAEAERAMKHRSAAVAAMKKAAQDPETRTQAREWLKRVGN